MKAMILAAGLGTRLKPLTDVMPKAMVPINGKPLLWHTIQKLKKSGFDEIIINLHHFGEQIVEYVELNDGFGIDIVFSDESDQLLDTGGGIKKASWFFDDGKPFLIHNADILSNIDLKLFYDYFAEKNAIASMAVTKRKTDRFLLFDDRDTLKGWTNKKTGDVKSPVMNFDPSAYQEFGFTGIHVLSPAVFELMPGFPDKFSIIDFYLSICNSEDIVAYQSENLNMMDVGKPESLLLAGEFVKEFLN